MPTIINTLGAGSGLDVQSLVSQLADAERAPRQSLLDARQARVAARISAMGQYRAALDSLVGALNSRVTSGVLGGIPAISDPSILTMRVDPGAIIARQSLEVKQLARSQTLSSAAIADVGAAIGQGTLTISFGKVAGTTAATGFVPQGIADLVVTIGSDRDSLTGLKDAINDAAAVAGAPLQAQIVSDADGSRLLLRGSSGEASGFTVTSAGNIALQAFDFNQTIPGGLDRTLTALDAEVAIDGVTLKRPGNAINDLIPGARLALAKAQPGTLVTLEANRDATQLTIAVADIASAFNELASLGRTLTAGGGATGSAGALVSDGATRRAVAGLAQLLGKPLVPVDGSAPTNLSQLGMTITREGAFTIEVGRLERAVRDHPASVERIVTALNARTSGTTSAGPLRQLADSFRIAAQGSAGQQTALQREAAEISRQREALDLKISRYRETMTRQFAALDRAVGQSRATQSFLTQQIDIWTRRNGF